MKNGIKARHKRDKPEYVNKFTTEGLLPLVVKIFWKTLRYELEKILAKIPDKIYNIS